MTFPFYIIMGGGALFKKKRIHLLKFFYLCVFYFHRVSTTILFRQMFYHMIPETDSTTMITTIINRQHVVCNYIHINIFIMYTSHHEMRYSLNISKILFPLYYYTTNYFIIHYIVYFTLFSIVVSHFIR